MISGRCLCASVSYEASGPFGDVLHCHCENCRRASGNFVAATRCEAERVRIDGEEHVRWHDLGYAKYGFCGSCGSQMFWVAADRPNLISLHLGGMDDTGGLRLGAVWYAGEAQPHHVLPPDVPHFSGNDDGQPD